MISPAAHTSKGLAKAFVSSAGGKGPEYPPSPTPLIVRPEARGYPLRSSVPQLKAQGLQLSAAGYNVVTRPQRASLTGGGFLLTSWGEVFVASSYPLGSPPLLGLPRLCDRLRQRREALFLINLLSKVAILVVDRDGPESIRSVLLRHKRFHK